MMTKNIQIRKAVEKDFSAINSLYFETYSLYYKNIPETYKKAVPRILPKGTFLNMIDHKDSLVIVAEIDKKVAGMLYALIEKSDEDEWTKAYNRVSVEEISVLPEFKNQGVGTLLMKEAEKWAKEKKIKDLVALVYDFNKKAIAFYNKNGYKPYSTQMKKNI